MQISLQRVAKEKEEKKRQQEKRTETQEKISCMDFYILRKKKYA